MRLTPLDLRRAQFSAAVRGFNRTEVTSFLFEAADDLELALSTAERARHEVTALHAQLAEHRRSASPARDTVLAAMRHRRRQAEESLEGAIATMRSALDEVRRPDPGLAPRTMSANIIRGRRRPRRLPAAPTAGSCVGYPPPVPAHPPSPDRLTRWSRFRAPCRSTAV